MTTVSMHQIVRSSLTTAVAFGLATLVGCSSAPENAGETDEAIKNGGVSDPGESKPPPPPPPPPSCPYPYNEYHWTPPAGRWLSCATLTQLSSPSRPLDRTNDFELQLLDLGCQDTALGAAGPAVPVGGTGWSFTTCPDTCAVRTLVHTDHFALPLASLTTNQRVNSCGSAPAAGHIVVLWDPHCPSACTGAPDQRL